MTRKGRVARVAGVVVDAEFPSGELPAIHNALRVEKDGEVATIVEVQEHISPFTVRGVAMSSTSGLQRGLDVLDTGEPITVPVGPATLGRLFNVLGEPVDGGPALPPMERHAIHSVSPALQEQRVAGDVFVTGV